MIIPLVFTIGILIQGLSNVGRIVMLIGIKFSIGRFAGLHHLAISDQSCNSHQRARMCCNHSVHVFPVWGYGAHAHHQPSLYRLEHMRAWWIWVSDSDSDIRSRLFLRFKPMPPWPVRGFCSNGDQWSWVQYHFRLFFDSVPDSGTHSNVWSHLHNDYDMLIQPIFNSSTNCNIRSHLQFVNNMLIQSISIDSTHPNKWSYM